MPITYNYAAITDVAAGISQFTGSMNEELETLYRQFTQLFAQDWSGEAGQAVDAARQQWNTGAREIETALVRLGQQLARSADDMQVVDRQVANEII